MVTIAETNEKTGYVTGVNYLSPDTLSTDDINGIGIANGAYALCISDGSVKFFDAENRVWIAQ